VSPSGDGRTLRPADTPRVALVIPSQAHVYGPMRSPGQLHLGAAYVAAAVEDVAAVSVFDADAMALDDAAFARRIRELRPDVVGLTVTTPTLGRALEMARIVRREAAEAWVVVGGYHATLKPEEVLAEPAVDVAVIGEGEEAFREIVLARAAGDGWGAVEGCMSRGAGGALQRRPRAPFPKGRLNGLRFPARHLFPGDYGYPDARHPRVAPIMTSRGCPGRCTYCNAHNLFEGRCHFRDARNVVDEIEDLVRRQGYQEIHVWDDNFTSWKRRVFEIRDELSRRGLRVPIALPGGIRADCADRDVLVALRDMGVYGLAVGVESGDQAVLDQAQKGITLDQVRQTFRIAHELGLETWAFFMLGLVGDTPETIRRTIDFALELDPDVAKFHILKPYPGTTVHRELQERGWLVTEDYAALGIHLPPVHRLPGLEPADMVDWQRRAYREFFFSSPARLWKQLRRIRTWHRFRVNLAGGINLLRLLASRRPGADAGARPQRAA
jgi:anaerobic magnesium-protoporphyrin IX monomethyl ester cyclase